MKGWIIALIILFLFCISTSSSVGIVANQYSKTIESKQSSQFKKFKELDKPKEFKELDK